MPQCMEASEQTSVEAMIELIEACPPGPWPNGWANWKNTIQAHQLLVDQFIKELKPSREVFSQERGIVIAGGGLKCFPSVWVNVNLLRMFGCTLPIQLWYLGDGEMDPYMKRVLQPLGVECVDAHKLETEYSGKATIGRRHQWTRSSVG
jgi:hypothetical protein